MFSRLKDLLEKDNCYSIGIRKRNDRNGLLFDGNYAPFHVLPISVHHWYADPIIFQKDGREYLFCEEYDRKKQKGFISVTELTPDYPNPPHKVLEIDTHLSYPCVFEMNQTVYMIPETTVKETVELYKAASFPDRWEFVRVLLSGKKWADTTVFQNGEHTLMLTFEQHEGNGGITKLKIWDATEIVQGNLREYPCEKEFDFSDSSRAGGKMFVDPAGGGIYRPAQICTPEYGYALNFLRVKVQDKYGEESVKTVYPENIRCDLKKQIIGIHTYALTDQYEIIDVKFDDPKLRYQIRRVWQYLCRKFRKCMQING